MTRNERRRGGDGQMQMPPPSTMTDAIFKNLSKNEASTQLTANKNVFQQLLAEMLSGGDQNTNNFDTVVSDEDLSKTSASLLRIYDPTLNFKIIQVMVNAGLTALTLDDPFNSLDKLLTQAEGSLILIRRSIQQTPEVLILDPLTELKDSNNVPDENIQLYLWLLPRLLPLFGNAKLDTLQDGVEAILVQIVLELCQIPAAWTSSTILGLYLHDCINCVMDAFRHDIKSTMKSKFNVEFPSPEFVSQLSMQKNVQWSAQPVHFVISDSSHAACFVIRIFSLLAKLSTDTNTCPPKRFNSYESIWPLESLSDLLEFMGIWDSFPNHSQNAMLIRRCMLDVLINAIEAKLEHQDEVCLLALRCASQILDRPVGEIDQIAEMSIARLALLILSIAHAESLTELHFASNFLPVVRRTMLDEYKWNLLHRDLKVSLLRVLHLAADEGEIQEQVSSQLRIVSNGMWTYQNHRLAFLDESLQIPVFVQVDNKLTAEDEVVEGISKRRKVAHDSKFVSSEIDAAGDLILKVYRALGSQDVRDLEGLSAVAQAGFGKLSFDNRCVVLEDIGRLPCLLTGHAKLGSSSDPSSKIQSTWYCEVCDVNEPVEATTAASMDELQDSELFQTLDLLRSDESSAKIPRIRFRAMQSLKRLLKHARGVESAVSETKLGYWCLQSLHSSAREVRIAAAHTLPRFPCFSKKAEKLRAERYACVHYIKDLSDREEEVVQETCVLAWSQMADVLEDDELALALIRLIDYLGHTSPFIVGVAYNEIKRVARAKRTTCRKLFNPFWKDISVGIVKQLNTKPQITRMVSELSSIQVDMFLTLTLPYTFRYMVLMKKIDVIERLVAAARATRREEVSFSKMVLEFLPSTLALLFVQENADERSICRIIGDVCPSLDTTDIGSLLRHDSISMAFEILRMCGDDEIRRKRGRAAIKIVAYHDSRRLASTNKKEKDTVLLPIFFERTALGIIANLSGAINDPLLPESEKGRNVRAIEEMIILGQRGISSALPQICACLQTALLNENIRTFVMSAWAAMIQNLPKEDFTPLICLTFSIVLKYWNNLAMLAQECIMQMLSFLFDNHGVSILKRMDGELPSLSSIPLLRKFEDKLAKWRTAEARDTPTPDAREKLRLLTKRCLSENLIILEIALIDLSRFLQDSQSYVQEAAGTEIPDAVISGVIRVLLDITVRSHARPDITTLCASCLGSIGAVDTNRIDAQRPNDDFILIENFGNADESINFVLYFLEKWVVKAFLAASDSKVQGFLSLTMQDLLRFCNFDDNVMLRPNAESISTDKQYRWNALSETAKNTLTPFLTSKYFMSYVATSEHLTYPIFKPTMNYRQWITQLLLDLYSKACGQRARNFFQICSRIVKGQDVALLNFLLPYITLNIIVSGADEDRDNICKELLAILEYKADQADRFLIETLKLCSETVFVLIDYLSRWVFEKKKANTLARAQLARQNNRHMIDDQEDAGDVAVANVERVLSNLPPKLMGERSLECQSYARALFYWEQHIRRVRLNEMDEDTSRSLYSQLQIIYAQIDEPDGLEGISTKLHALDPNQQLLEHKKAGRWMAVQSWYEHSLAVKPDEAALQFGLLMSLKESGQYESLLHFIDGVKPTSDLLALRTSAFAVEAAWMSSKWTELEGYLEKCPKDVSGDISFDINIGQAIAAYRSKKMESISKIVAATRVEIAKLMTYSSTTSIRQCREQLFRLHILTEIEDMVAALKNDIPLMRALRKSLDGRLKLIGPSIKEKQYLLALRRAFYTVSDAGDLGDQLAPVEQARLFWTEGRHRKAIKTLESVLAITRFNIQSISLNAPVNESTASMVDLTSVEGLAQPQSHAKARAILLYAKWLDNSGQSQSSTIVGLYRKASAANVRWEKGHYYLGRHYNKILETEEKLPPNKKTQTYLNGETVKLVCQNYMRALSYGTKYVFQTLPRTLTLWLDLGAQVEVELDSKFGAEEFRKHIMKDRVKQLDSLNITAKKYCLQRVPAYIYLAAFPQVMSRICHPSDKVWAILQALIVRVLVEFPQHGLWSLMAAYKSTQQDRKQRGLKILEKLKENSKVSGQRDIRGLMGQSQKLVHELLNMCNAELKGKPSRVNLQEDLRFNHSVAPIKLIVPVQAMMTVSFPPDNTLTGRHNPFAREQATIERFDEEAEVMNSLQKPRRIVIYGSDGKSYPFLCKPKDDLRKDARLMEFNTIINKLLKKDIEASKRQLLIKTYAVTPLNEECGLIEWVNNVRPLRDILIKSYRAKSVSINYQNIRLVLDDACSGPDRIQVFTETLLPMFPPVFHEWFVELFAEPATWMAARLAYARTSAVMSMVGHVLGLGDRHGENILFDETSGETLHVDFNCLFDKGLTFEKPERVPFRLTQNMVDALGVTGFEGPFRLSCEVVMRILRENEDSLMTVLETFLHDPLVEWMTTKKRKSTNSNKVPDNPVDVLEIIQNKIRGLHAKDPVPLSVEGQVDDLINQAVAPENLAAMYIGWCAFF